MKKHRHHHSSRKPYAVETNDRQTINSSIFTVFYNIIAVIVYGIFLMFWFDGTLASILFSVMAVLQLILCGAIGFKYNNKDWFVSALAIFVIACVVIVFETM